MARVALASIALLSLSAMQRVPYRQMCARIIEEALAQ